MLKSRHSFPAGGFLFFEARTGWTSTPHIGFDQTVTEIIRHRNANAGRFDWKTDRASVEQELETYTVARLRSIRGGEQWITESPPDGAPVFTSRPRVRQQGAVAAAGAGSVKKIVAGIGLMLDFLGPTLQAVDHATAENRAKVCSDCPNNKPGGIVSDAAGEALRLLLQSRASYNLVTSYDEKLQSCEACDCNLKLKPHVQLDYILSRLTPTQRARLDDRCWILAEEQNAGALTL